MAEALADELAQLEVGARHSLAFSALSGYFHNACDLYVALRAAPKPRTAKGPPKVD